MGFIHAGTHNRDSACAAYDAYDAYDASLQAQIENRRQNLNVEIIFPKQYGTFENYIAMQKKLKLSAMTKVGSAAMKHAQ